MIFFCRYCSAHYDMISWHAIGEKIIVIEVIIDKKLKNDSTLTLYPFFRHLTEEEEEEEENICLCI